MHPSCKDFDLCADCEALPIPVHPIDHPLLKIKNPKAIIPQVLREGQEIREKTEPVIPAWRNIPLPQIPVLQPLPAHIGTMGAPVMPPRPPLPVPVPVPVPVRIDSSAQTVEAPRVSSSTQTVRKRRSVASIQTTNHGEEKGVQVEVPTPVVPPRIIRIPIVDEEPRREPESPKIIVLPSVPTTEPVAPKPVAPKPIAPKPAAVPVPIPPKEDPVSVRIPVVLPPMQPAIVKAPSPPALEAINVPSPIAPMLPPLPATPPVAPKPEMTQTITQPASLYTSFIASRPALEPIRLSAAFVEDMNVADGTTFPPGAEFIKCWKIINDGRRDWPAETILVFVGGQRMAAFPNAPDTYDVGKVAISQAVDVWAGDLKAPEEAGVYNSFWRLKNGENGEFFGHRVSFVHES